MSSMPELSDKMLTRKNPVAKISEKVFQSEKGVCVMEKERIDRMNELDARQKAAGLEANEREELRILQMEHLAEMMPADEEER